MCSNGLPPILSHVVSLLKENSPQGIGLMDITKELYNLYGYRLNPNDYNHKNLYDLFEELSKKSGNSVVLVKQSEKLFKSDRIFMDEVRYQQWIQTFIKRGDVETLENLVIPLIPEDVPLQQNNTLIACTSVPSEAFNQQRIIAFKVEVIFVESPNILFLRLIKNKQNYQNLRQNLRFYEGSQEETDPYILPKELAVEGYMCAVKNPKDWDNWHRANIVKSRDDDRITLYAIDFGNFIISDRKDLRLLKTSMYEMPPLAVKVSLSGIKPPNNQNNWSDLSIDYLRSTVKNYKNKFECGFLYQLGNNYFSVFLQSVLRINYEDVSIDYPIYLHESLIKDGFAQMSKQDFNEIKTNINFCDNFVSEAIEEPLLAIKYEPDFHDYESPSLPSHVSDDSKNDEHLVNGTVDSNVETKEESTPVLVPRVVPKEINYKRLYFTTDKSMTTTIYSYFKSEDFPFIPRTYFNEDNVEMAFPCFERKYSDESVEKRAKYVYYNKDVFPQPIFDYYRAQYEEVDSSFEDHYYPVSGDHLLSSDYYTSEDCPFVDHKYFRTQMDERFL